MIGSARVDDLGVELARAVPLELGTDQRDVFGRVEEAVRGAVDRGEAAAVLDVLDQGFLLVGVDLRLVRVDHQDVILRQRRRVEVRHRLGVGDVDPSGRQHRDDLGARSLGRWCPWSPRKRTLIGVEGASAAEAPADWASQPRTSGRAHASGRVQVLESIPDVSWLRGKGEGRSPFFLSSVW